nr:MAG TPA: hypothetical protein [Caudoviricetes sp.]
MYISFLPCVISRQLMLPGFFIFLLSGDAALF